MVKSINVVLDANVLVDLAEYAAKLGQPDEVSRQCDVFVLLRGTLNKEITNLCNSETVKYVPFVSAHIMTATKLTLIRKHGVEAAEKAMKAIEVLLSSGYFQFDDRRFQKAALVELAGRRSFVKGRGRLFADHDWEDEAIIQMAASLPGTTHVLTADDNLRFVIEQTAKNIAGSSTVRQFMANHEVKELVNS